jgi:flagellar biosynthesis/type III secretory pathway M-ring protein FliF/YscJ
MDSIKRALESVGRMWAALNATQRVILSASAALMVLLLIWGSASSVPTMVRVVGPEVDASKRQEILSKFQERNQKHEVRGAEIFVPKEDADRVVLELAGEGSMTNNGVWKFLEQSDIFAPRWTQEKRFQIALQSRLEGMIRSIESVKYAAVVINPGSTHYQLGFAGPKPSASVQVELQEGRTLSRKNVQAIAGLVARAVSGIEEDQVHIMDTKGIAYRAAKAEGPPGAAWDTAREIEEDIEKRLKDTFAFSGAKVIVRVQTKTINSRTEEKKFSNPKIANSQETITRRPASAPPAPPVRKGEGDVEPAPQPPVPGTETQSSTAESHVFDETRTVQDNPAGQIERTTVGVLIPVEVGPDGKELAEAEKLLPKLKEFVRLAAHPAKSEDVSVQFIPTKRPEPVAAAVASESPLSWVGMHASKIAMFGLALAGLFVLLRVVQTAMARETVEEIESLTNALAETQEASAELAGPAAGDLGRLKQNVKDMVGRNPKSVAVSLKSFMGGR